MILTTADKKYILATIHAASAECYQALEKRMKTVMKDQDATAAKEIVASGAASVERFRSYLIKHLQLEEDEYLWLED